MRAETVDLTRELRDLARRQIEDTSRIAECVRIIREETVKHTGLLAKIEREQAIENRSHERER
ncbi:pyruvate kinase [Methylobacterium sp. RAS18]|nr:pyruvate kinase [Methylobacterium sp. RAS18]